MGFDLKRRRMLWGAGAVLFFFLYSFIAVASPSRMFNSPDEMANYYFATRVAETGMPRAADGFWQVAGGRVHPRSVTIVEGDQVPESFHGLPVFYGIVGAVAGKWVLIFLTPFVAVLAVLAWRRVVGVLFGPRAGDIAAVLLAILPVWAYYANRGLYHNVLFTSLLIFAAYFFIAQPFSNLQKLLPTTYYLLPTIDAPIAGLMLGFALWVRTAEIVWVIPAVLILLVVFRKKITGIQIVSFVIAVLVAFLPTLLLNQLLYDHPFGTGYTAQTAGVSTLSGGASLVGKSSSVVEVFSMLFPFGFHPKTALIHFNRYFLALPWWHTIVLIVGLIWFAQEAVHKKQNRKLVWFGLTFLGVAGWLAFVYGSWVIHDNPDPTAVTIGISYSRYWLPAFVLGTGIAGAGVAGVLSRLTRGARFLILAIGCVFFLSLAYRTIFLTTGDGLRDITVTLREYAAVKSDIAKRIESGAVIVADRADKIFFPDWSVMYPLRDDTNYTALPALVKTAPVYYYGITLAPDDERFHNDEKLVPLGLRLVPIVTYDDHTLYQFVLRSL